MSVAKSLKILITAGATAVNIDNVRKITNTSSGDTGENIARYMSLLGHEVTLVTSAPRTKSSATYYHFETYDELLSRMEVEITSGTYDVIIHSAAVPDYKPEGMYVVNGNFAQLQRLDAAGKISSKHPELYLRLVPTEKIIDLIRYRWGFPGILVKFKLEVGCTDDELIEIATASMKHSMADHIVANCIEWAKERAIIISENTVAHIERSQLPHELTRLLTGALDAKASREKIAALVEGPWNSRSDFKELMSKENLDHAEVERACKIIDGYWCCSKDLRSIILTGEAICTK